MPNFCRYMADRFGRGWYLGAGSVSAADLRRAKRAYEAMIGCRAYSLEYADKIARGEIA